MMVRGNETADPITLMRIVSLKEAARLRGVSVDSLKRNCSEKILTLSPRRRGMRLADALMVKVQTKSQP